MNIDSRSPTELENAIKSYVILMDSRFATKDAFELFINRYRSDLVHNPIKMTSTIIDKLQYRAERPIPNRPNAQIQAKQALKLIKRYVTEKILEVRDDQVSQNAPKITGDANYEIFSEVAMHIRMKPFIVLTFDSSLTKRLQALVTYKIHDAKDLCIARIDSGGKLQPNRTIAQYREWRSKLSKLSKLSDHSQHFEGTPFRIVQQIVPDQGIIIPTRQVIQEGSELKTQSGQNLTLQKELGKGGEGTIYALDDSKTVCKIYLKEKLTEGRKQKIELMLTRKISDAQICYPQEAVYDSDGTFRGFIMPKAEGRELGCHLFHPGFIHGQTHWNRIHSTKLALTILDKIKFLHRLNILIGDINSKNILVEDENTVYFVDCDSYQIEGFTCPAGTAAFTAPELSDRCPGGKYESVLRTKEEELFAIAVLLFQIFIPGKHPYGHIGGESVADNIKQGHFPYPLGDRFSDRAPVGYYKYAWSHLPHHMKGAFDQCFHTTKRSNTKLVIDEEKTVFLPLYNGRLGIDEWKQLIRHYLNILQNEDNVYTEKQILNGYDLSISPLNIRRIRKEDGSIPRPLRTDGRTDAQEDNEKWIATMIRKKRRWHAKPPSDATTAKLSCHPIPSNESPHTQKVRAPSKKKPSKK